MRRKGNRNRGNKEKRRGVKLQNSKRGGKMKRGIRKGRRELNSWKTGKKGLEETKKGIERGELKGRGGM